jgi:lipopolysaccharide export system permease protein
MKKLHAYYIKQTLLYIVLSLLLLCVLYVAIDLISNFRKYGDTLPEIFTNFSLKFPAIFYQMQAISLFLANTIVLSLIYSRKEFVTLGTSGISLKRIYFPIIAMTFGLSVLFCGIYDVIGPKVYVLQQMQKHGSEIGDQFRFSFVNTKVWYQKDNQIYHIGYIYPNSGAMDDVQVFFFNDQFILEKYVQAQRVNVVDQKWKFKEGLNVDYLNGEPRHSYEFDTLALDNLQSIHNLKKIQFDPRQLRADQLFVHLIQDRFRASEKAKYETNLYERIIFAFFPLILLFMGSPLISVTRRHYSLLFNVGMTFIVSVIFWTSFKIFITLGSSGKIPPLIASLIVPIVFILMGAYLWWRKRI